MSQSNDLLQHLRANGLRLRAETESDGQLLDRFLDRRDDAAFEALVARLGPVVWAVCRRMLPDPADADDAFQATFLVLARKGRSVVPRDRVGNWLYGVAYHAARKARADRARRRDKEQRAAAMAETHALDPRPTADLAAHIDRELGRLPAKYRAPVVLCDLEGKTRQEAARHLGWPEGTVAGRLARARAMLARRLSRYAPGVSAAAVAVALADPAGALGPPAGVLQATRQRVLGPPAELSPRVAALSDGVMRAMLVRKLQAVAVGLGLVLAAGLAVGAVAARSKPDPPTPPPAAGPVVERPAPPPDPAAVLRDRLVGRWQVDAGTRNGQPLTAWEKRGYLIEFAADGALRVHRGAIRDQRTYTWAVGPADKPGDLTLTPPDGNAAGRVRLAAEWKDDDLTLTWDEPPTGKRGRGAGTTVRLTLTRSAPEGAARAGLVVAPAAENVVGSRLAGTWEPDPDLARRLGTSAAPDRLTITTDPTVARDIPREYQALFADKRIYLAGRIAVRGPAETTYPFVLVEHLGNPLLVYFLPAGPDVCAAEEAATVALVPGAKRDDDLLILAAFDTATHAPAGGYRRMPDRK
jgi:RNA polymerase sigma factor (sigma-70 family)